MKFLTYLAIIGAAVNAVHLREEPAAKPAAAVEEKKDPKVSLEQQGDQKGIKFAETDKTTEEVADKNGGFQYGVPFMLKSRQDGNLVMSYATPPEVDKNGVFEEKFTVVMADPAKWIGKYWVFDLKTQTLRAYTHSSYALTWDGSNAVIKPFDKDDETQKQIFDKGTYQLINAKDATKCYSSDNTEQAKIKVAKCDGKDIEQKWYPQYHYQAQGPHWNRLQNE